MIRCLCVPVVPLLMWHGPALAARPAFGDTVVFTRAACGMRYNVYLWHLFHGRGPATFAYRPRTAQDLRFLEGIPDRAHLVFTDRKGRTLFEGEVDGGHMHGPVTWFRADGSVERREFWGFEGDLQAMPELEWSDVEHEVGTWSFHDRKGRARREQRYATLAVRVGAHVVHYRVVVTVRFGRKGTWRRERMKVLDSTEPLPPRVVE